VPMPAKRTTQQRVEAVPLLFGHHQNDGDSDHQRSCCFQTT
jgi:hypothetical protein